MALVILSGALANKPLNGGNAWSRLSWILGFKRLGFEVCFVEQLEKGSCLDGSGGATSFINSINLAYFKQTMARFRLEATCALVYNDGEEVYGLGLDQLSSMAKEACLLFNFSGHLTLKEIKDKIACKLYYDDDPGFTQFWHAAGNSGARLTDHDFHFTIGENIGKADCPIPTNGVTWRHTRPPVTLEDWPVLTQNPFEGFTTVASWRGAYGPVQYNGKSYGLKVHEFRKFIKLPQLSSQLFTIALQIHPSDKKDLDSLVAHGWRISDPKAAADSTEAFQRFVQSSGAEFSVAQGIYVDTNSGWFSDRTVRYLASGRPALVQDTGFSRNYPTGEGLIGFSNIAQAVEGAERIVSNYEHHCRAARRLAEEYFDARNTVGKLVNEIGLSVP